MPIDPDFPRNHKVIGKHNLADGEHFHFVWGPGRPDPKRQQNLKFRKHTKQEEKNMYR